MPSLKFPFSNLPKIIVNQKEHFLLGLGIQRHYQIAKSIILQNRLRQTNFWVYDKAKLDIIFEMSKSNRKKLLYITQQNFEVVQIQSAYGNDFGKLNKKQDLLQKLTADKNNNNRITVTKKLNGMDVHPLEAYIKLCRYAGLRFDPVYMDMFSNSAPAAAFSNFTDMSVETPFLPFMADIRKIYLNTQGLKLKKIERQSSATTEQASQIIKMWKQYYQIEQIEKGQIVKQSEEDLKAKIDWIAKHQYGYSVPKQFVLQGFGIKYQSLIAT